MSRAQKKPQFIFDVVAVWDDFCISIIRHTPHKCDAQCMLIGNYDDPIEAASTAARLKRLMTV